MSIIIAAKGANSIYFAYDTAVNQYVFYFGDVLYNISGNSNKVRPVSRNITLGFAGYWNDDQIFERFSSRLNRSSLEEQVSVLKEVIKLQRLKELETITRLFEMQGREKTEIRKLNALTAYLFGIVDGTELKLLSSGKGVQDAELYQVENYGGIGSGMHEDVDVLLKNRYKTDMTDVGIKELLKNAVTKSEEISSERSGVNETIIKGFGLARLTKEGYEQLEFSPASLEDSPHSPLFNDLRLSGVIR